MRVNGKDPAWKKRTMPTYKLRSDIEQTTNLKKILEERVLDSHVTLSLRESLDISKEFHDTIMDLVKRKDKCHNNGKGRSRWRYGGQPLYSTSLGTRHNRDAGVALIDHGSEINLMSTEVYKKGKWPINTNHGWKIRAAMKASEDLYGACPSIPITIIDVEIDQRFLFQDSASHPIIPRQPYITSSRMETKVFENGAAFAWVRILDRKNFVQFLTIRANHERNRDSLGEDASDF